MTRVQRLFPVLVLVVIFLAVGWSLLPFEFAAGVRCGPPLLGGDPESETSVGLILPEIDCRAKARSRLLVTAMISLAAAGAGTAAVALRPLSLACYSGNHEDCRDWWPEVVTENLTGLGCQCECHAEVLSSY